jgi:hypothetical protein
MVRDDHNALDDRTNGGYDPFAASPEDLHELRATVEEWLSKARSAVWSFKRDDGSFQKDSDPFDHLSITTTARCYMGLAYAERQLGKPGKAENLPDWRTELRKGLATLDVKFENEMSESIELFQLSATPGNSSKLNNFELAHYADFAFARCFSGRFGGEVPKWPKGLQNVGCVEATLAKALIERLTVEHPDIAHDGEIFFEAGKPGSRHFFVTLHILRALSILERCQPAQTIRPPDEKLRRSIANSAKQLCIAQCFYWPPASRESARR